MAYKDKYTREMVSKEMFENWKLENPKYVDIKYNTYERYWKIWSKALKNEIIQNPFGVDLPEFLGNMSIKLLNTDVLPRERLNIPTKKLINPDTFFIKSYWKRSRRFRAVPVLLGMDEKSEFLVTLHKGAKGKGNRYMHVPKFGTMKAEPLKEKSIFDLA